MLLHRYIYARAAARPRVMRGKVSFILKQIVCDLGVMGCGGSGGGGGEEEEEEMEQE